MDEYKLARISKKPTNIRSWSPPPDEVVVALEKVLQMKKINTLQYLDKRGPDTHVDAHVESDIDNVIRSFLDDIRETNLPPQLDSRDYDHDYQVSRQKFFEALYSNESNAIKSLNQTLKEENANLRDTNEFVRNFRRTYNESLRKLSEEEQEMLKNPNKVHQLIETLIEEDNDSDEEFGEVLKDLNETLDTLTADTQPLQKVIDQLEHMDSLLSNCLSEK